MRYSVGVGSIHNDRNVTCFAKHSVTSLLLVIVTARHHTVFNYRENHLLGSGNYPKLPGPGSTPGKNERFIYRNTPRDATVRFSYAGLSGDSSENG